MIGWSEGRCSRLSICHRGPRDLPCRRLSFHPGGKGGGGGGQGGSSNIATKTRVRRCGLPVVRLPLFRYLGLH